MFTTAVCGPGSTNPDTDESTFTDKMTPSTDRLSPTRPSTMATMALRLPGALWARVRRSATVPVARAESAANKPTTNTTGIHAVTTPMMPSTKATVASVPDTSGGTETPGMVPATGMAVPNGSTERWPFTETSAVHCWPL